ncbi:MAG: cysteine dioxygenase family protein [Myxococcales bacterium]|nr:cysteine dioxygenase family protein [Myxococcales bacterium]
MSPSSHDPLAELIAVLERKPVGSPRETAEVLRRSRITAEHLAAFADFDHPAEDSYGRKLVHDGGHFEVMVMSWLPGDMAAIHDHGRTQWGAVRLFGRAEHATFRLRDGQLSTQARSQVSSGTTLPVHHQLIHQMGNQGSEPYLTLHVYGAPPAHEGITSQARLYELHRDRVQRIDGGMFFGLRQDEVTSEEPGVRADACTRLRHHVELLKRQCRIHGVRVVDSEPASVATEIAQWLFGGSLWRAVEAAVQPDAHPHSEGSRIAVVDQEVFAAAVVQRMLVDKCDSVGEFKALAEPLESLLAEPCRGGFAGAYLRQVGQRLRH